MVEMGEGYVSIYVKIKIKIEETIERIDAEDSELYLLGDINCNLLSLDFDTHTSDLVNILDIYDLTQLITEPTRITPVSQTLIDLCITNYPEKISTFGVLPLGISDHSLVYIVRKSTYPKTTAKTIKEEISNTLKAQISLKISRT